MENSPLKWLASISVGLVVGVVFLSNLETVGEKEKSVVQLPLGLDAFKVPADNPLTKPKIELGKQLYFDKRLSSDNTVSCASCHDPGKGWSNDAAFATGVDLSLIHI